MSLLNFNTIKELFLPDKPSLEGNSDTNNYSAPIITANNKPINEGEIEHQDVTPLSDEEKAQKLADLCNKHGITKAQLQEALKNKRI